MVAHAGFGEETNFPLVESTGLLQPLYSKLNVVMVAVLASMGAERGTKG